MYVYLVIFFSFMAFLYMPLNHYDVLFDICSVVHDSLLFCSNFFRKTFIPKLVVLFFVYICKACIHLWRSKTVGNRLLIVVTRKSLANRSCRRQEMCTSKLGILFGFSAAWPSRGSENWLFVLDDRWVFFPTMAPNSKLCSSVNKWQHLSIMAIFWMRNLFSSCIKLN
jgi:hypothetical protein